MANAMQGVEVEFRDLTKEAQERLYLSDKEKFKNEVANSEYVDIRRMVAENENSSSKLLNAMFREEITNEDKQDDDVLKAILANPKFTMEEETRKLYAESVYWGCRRIAAKDAGSSSEFLNAMLREEITNEDKQDDDVLKAILANPKFTMEEETRKLYAESVYWGCRRIAAKDADSSSESLNAMLREEITNRDKQNENVINAILSNPKFTMEEETRKLCAESVYWRYRQIAAKDEDSSSECLNAMLREEITNEGRQDKAVIKAILANSKFTMEKETRKLCAEWDNWEYRQIAAEDEGSSSEFLNAMLREEITNEDKQDDDVIRAILSNKNLLLQDDLRNACAEFANWEIRLMIAKDAETPKELLEAMREREGDSDVRNEIRTNLSHKEKNKQMLEVLKGFIPSENQAVECLEKLKAIMY